MDRKSFLDKNIKLDLANKICIVKKYGSDANRNKEPFILPLKEAVGHSRLATGIWWHCQGKYRCCYRYISC